MRAPWKRGEAVRGLVEAEKEAGRSATHEMRKDGEPPEPPSHRLCGLGVSTPLWIVARSPGRREGGF